jgi:hypothetical protein
LEMQRHGKGHPARWRGIVKDLPVYDLRLTGIDQIMSVVGGR